MAGDHGCWGKSRVRAVKPSRQHYKYNSLTCEFSHWGALVCTPLSGILSHDHWASGSTSGQKQPNSCAQGDPRGDRERQTLLVSAPSFFPSLFLSLCQPAACTLSSCPYSVALFSLSAWKSFLYTHEFCTLPTPPHTHTHIPSPPPQTHIHTYTQTPLFFSPQSILSL